MDDRSINRLNSFSLYRQPSLDQSLRQRTLEVIHVIAEHLSDHEQVMSMVQEAAKQSPHFRWNAVSLASGLPGLALSFCFLARAFPDESWFEIAVGYLSMAAEATQSEPLTHPGLFEGLSGLANGVSASRSASRDRVSGQLANYILAPRRMGGKLASLHFLSSKKLAKLICNACSLVSWRARHCQSLMVGRSSIRQYCTLPKSG